MPLTGKDVWAAIVKAGLLSGPYDPRTNQAGAPREYVLRPSRGRPHDKTQDFSSAVRSERPALAPSPSARVKGRYISTSSFKVTVIPSHAGLGLLSIVPMSPENS